MTGFHGKIAIGIPHLGGLPGYFFDTVMGLSRPAATVIIRVDGKAVDLARNEIVEAALADPEVTHLFFMDSDMRFPPDALMRLFLHYKPVVSGTYISRATTPVPHLYAFHHRDDEAAGTCPLGMNHRDGFGTWYRPLLKEFAGYLKAHPEYYKLHDMPETISFPPTTDSLVRIDGAGGGCLLVERSVLEQLRDTAPDPRYPWFKCHPGSAGGEDFYFFERCRELGIETWGDFAVQCAHEFKYAWVDRFDLKERFRIGEPDEYDYEAREIIVDVGPAGMESREPQGPEGYRAPGPDVEGYFTPAQGIQLFELAQQADPAALVVELGSYKGRSTIALAQAHERVIAVDHFKGESFAWASDPGAAFPYHDHLHGTYRKTLEANLERYGVRDRVTIVESDTAAAAAAFHDGDVGLLFIDAAHDYEHVRADFDAWRPKLAPSAKVVLDDRQFAGVQQLLFEAVRDGWQYEEGADRLAILTQPAEGGQ